jgi:hypothetical protein
MTKDKHTITLLTGIILCSLPSFASFNDVVSSNGYSGTLGAGAATAKYRLSTAHNPAALQDSCWGVSLSHYFPYQISELAVSEIGLFKDWSAWGVGISALQLMVTDNYFEHTLNAQAALRIIKPLTLGLGLDLRRLEIEDYGSAFYPGESLGFVAGFKDKLFLGFFVSDLLSQFIDSDIVHPVYQGGISIRLPRGFSLDFDLRRDHNQVWRHYFSQTLVIRKILEINAAIADRPYQFSLGVSVYFKGFGASHAVQMHQDLGRTHHYGLKGAFK